MKHYTKQIDGKSVIKTLKEIVIRKDGKQTFNPSEEMVLEDGWVEYIAPVYEPTEAELLGKAKKRKLDELRRYDEGKEVNNCIIVYQDDAFNYWADKHERDSLKNAIKDCIDLGRTVYRLDLRNLGVSVAIPCEMLLTMLRNLELYAIDCYNNTTDHMYAIDALTTVEEVEAYDFKSSYPEKLTFNL